MPDKKPATFVSPWMLWCLRLFSWLVVSFLLLPIVVIIPLSFNAEPFFSFTPDMLRLKPEAYSWRWYQDVFDNSNWLLAIKNSFSIGIAATLLATLLGTCAALGLHQPALPYRRMITAILISPMIVPLIIIAAGMFFFYSRLNLVATYPGLILAHTTLGAPFVVITVTASLTNLDPALYRAALSLGASPWRAFRTVTLPLIKPGVLSGALFAFITSFDEIVLVLFLAGPKQRTIPREMFAGLREQINPSILAVATLLIMTSILFLFCVALLKRNTQKTPAP